MYANKNTPNLREYIEGTSAILAHYLTIKMLFNFIKCIYLVTY